MKPLTNVFALFTTGMFAAATLASADDHIELKQHTAPVQAIQWSADGKRVATVCADGLVCFWDAVGKLVSKTEIEKVERPLFTFTPDLNRMAVVRSSDVFRSRTIERNGGQTFVYSLPDGELICKFNARTAPIRDYPFSAKIVAFEFSPDGTRLAVGGSVEAVGGRHGEPGGIATIWDVSEAKIVRRSTEFTTLVSSFAWDEDGDVLMIGTAGSGTELAEAGRIHAWHKNKWLPAEGEPVRTVHKDFRDSMPVGVPGYADIVGVRQLCLVDDQLIVFINNADKEAVRTMDLMTGESQSVDTTEFDWRKKFKLNLSPLGTMVTAHKEDTITIYSADTLKQIRTIKLPSTITSVGFGASDKKIAIGTDAGTVQIHTVLE